MDIMDALAAAVAASVSSSSVAAACAPDMFVVSAWSFTQHEVLRGIYGDLDIEYQGATPIRMVDAVLRFHDVLGRSLALVGLPEDLHVEPGETFTLDNTFVAGDERLLHVSDDDIVASTCVRSVVYADGTVERFD